MAVRRVYVSGPMSTKTFTVDSTSACPIGVFVETADTATTAPKLVENVLVYPGTANVSRCVGITYQGDFKGKYASATGTGIGTAQTQNSVAASDKVTCITLGCGGIVEAFAGTANLLPGQDLIVSDGGSVTSAAASSNVLSDWQRRVGRALTHSSAASDKVLMILM